MPPIPWKSCIAAEGVPTADKRLIEAGALKWRTLPLSLMAIVVDSHGGMPMTQSVNVGRIDAVTRERDGDTALLMASGVFDDEDPVAVMVAHKVAEKYLRGVSIDVGDVQSELEVIEEDEDGWPTDWLDRLTAGTIGMATVCGFPAFGECWIEVDGEALTAAMGALTASGTALPELDLSPEHDGTWVLTAAAAPSDAPPAAWFDDPQLDGPTALTIGEADVNGLRQVYGHVAAWGVEHIGMPGRFAPRSPSGYAYFRTGLTVCADGSEIPTGKLTAGIGHADLRQSAAQATEHYDRTDAVWADVVAGEDQHGIWIAGATRALTDAKLREIRACGLSGDWRGIGGALEMVAALSVPVQGFPLPRSLAADGAPMALVAAGGHAVLAASKARASGLAHTDIARAVRTALSQERRLAEQDARAEQLAASRRADRIAKQNARLRSR